MTSKRQEKQLGFEYALRRTRAYRQELLTLLLTKIQQEDARPIKGQHPDWEMVGDLERDCSLLEQLIKNYVQPEH